MKLWPSLFEVEGFYLESRRQEAKLGESEGLRPSQWGGYFDLAAVSSRFGGKLIGEGELAYSAIGLPGSRSAQPLMTRLNLRGNWGKVGYGISYRSFGSGFVATSGAKVEHERDEDRLWAEYDFGSVRFRGVAGETWEQHSAISQITLTRTATTSLALNRPLWNASLSSAYSVIEQDPPVNQKIAAWTNGMALLLRPTAFLRLEPNLGFKQEWDEATGLQSDTASAAFAWWCAPAPNLRLTGRASLFHTIGDDQLKHASSLNTAAGLNWHIGKSFLGDQSLSLQLDYTNDLRPNANDPPQSRFIGMIRFKLAGF